MNTQTRTQKPTMGNFEPIVEKNNIIVTKELLNAYMIKHPYIYQEKPEEYEYMTDEEWLETDKWADMASKMMVLSMRKCN
jgi:hypothetical protein